MDPPVIRLKYRRTEDDEERVYGETLNKKGAGNQPAPFSQLNVLNVKIEEELVGVGSESQCVHLSGSLVI